MADNSEAIIDAGGDGTAGVDVEDRRILALCSHTPATAATSAMATPADANNGIPERGGGGGGGPDGSEWVVGLSEAVIDDPAEAADDDNGVIGAVACVVCLLSVNNLLLIIRMQCVLLFYCLDVAVVLCLSVAADLW